MAHNNTMTFAEATARYVHRFTMDHIPMWALEQRTDGSYYAPQFASDREWFEHTLFPPNHPLGKRVTDCYTTWRDLASR